MLEVLLPYLPVLSPTASRRVGTRASVPHHSAAKHMHAAALQPLSEDRPSRSGAQTLRGISVLDYDAMSATYADIDKVLGNGMWGKVYLMRHRTTGERVAVKSMFRRSPPHETLLERLFISEVRALHALRDDAHPCLPHMHGAYRNRHSYHIVMEPCPGEDLFERISTRGPYPESHARLVFRQVLAAVHHLHTRSPPVVHRDIKPENIIVDDTSGRVSLVDFGLAAVGEGGVDVTQLRTNVGTPHYTAPEVTARTVSYNGFLADAWSAATVAYVLLAGCPPFHGSTPEETARAILRGRYRLDYPAFQSVSASAKAYLRRGLVVAPTARLTVAAACEHPWLTDEDELALVNGS